MYVVFAGCATCRAEAYDNVIYQLTRTLPVVNEDLAYTSETTEFTVESRASQKLYDTYQTTLSQLDQQYVDAHKEPLKRLADGILPDDVQTIMRRNRLFLDLAPRIKQSYKGLKAQVGEQAVEYIQKTWRSVIDQLYATAKPPAIIRYIENIRTQLKTLKSPDSEDLAVSRYLQDYTTLRVQVETEIQRANNEFIETMEKTLPIKQKNYLSIVKEQQEKMAAQYRA